MEGNGLQFERDASGGFTAPADLIAAGFGWSAEILKEKMRRGLVASTVEKGQGEDEGSWRLSVRCGNRRWQAIIDANGRIARQHTDYLSATS